MKGWYLNVQEETMAPARMMQFADQHIINCEACQHDPELAEEIENIRDFILPESKIPKSERNDGQKATPEISPEISPDDENKKNETDDSDKGDNDNDKGDNNTDEEI
jgi:hypothetical protein